MNQEKKSDGRLVKMRPVEMLVEMFLGDKEPNQDIKENQDKSKDHKKDKRAVYKILGVLVLGVILLVISKTFLKTNSIPTSNSGEEKAVAVANLKANTELEESVSYEVQMEKRLKNILKSMQGVGQVEVMITTTYGKEIILAEDVTSHTAATKEEDREGGIREVNNSDVQKKTVMQNGNVASGNSPVIVKEKQPEIQGVLVIAQGANNSIVKQSISESAQILLGIPAHRVTVHQLKSSNK